LPYDQREKTIIAIRVRDFIKAKKK
jgi:hypothetical protein